MLIAGLFGKVAAQESKQVVRLAKLQIDSAQLDNYKDMLRQGIETSMRVEPGVLQMYAVSDKNNPTYITILEIYASLDAYNSHLETPHFRKYKIGTQHMVKSLELVNVDPVIFATKNK